MKSFIYLISPNKIRNESFYNELNIILKTKKIKFFQLRLKRISEKKLILISSKVKKITKANKTKLIINDKPHIAKKVGADGCHIGQKDISYEKCRNILGKKKIIGITCHNSKKLSIKANKIGANYVAFGSFFKSNTKKTNIKAKLRTLRWAKKKIRIPIVAIGGINNLNYKKLLDYGANYIALSNYIWNTKGTKPLNAIKKIK